MSRSQFYSIKLFILRHAWLNLWDKHMTTGRINQVTSLSAPSIRDSLEPPNEKTLTAKGSKSFRCVIEDKKMPKKGTAQSPIKGPAVFLWYSCSFHYVDHRTKQQRNSCTKGKTRGFPKDDVWCRLRSLQSSSTSKERERPKRHGSATSVQIMTTHRVNIQTLWTSLRTRNEPHRFFEPRTRS